MTTDHDFALGFPCSCEPCRKWRGFYRSGQFYDFGEWLAARLGCSNGFRPQPAGRAPNVAFVVRCLTRVDQARR